MFSLIKKVFFYVTFCIILAVTTCLAAELGIRVYYSLKPQKRPIFLPDPYLGHIHNPNIKFNFSYNELIKVSVPHRTNSLGLMGKELAIPKSKNTFRILILGDSFTEALQVPEDKNFCTLLEKSLNQENVEVINAGVSAYSSMLSYQLFRKRLMGLQPDLVILQLFANDVFEDNRLKAMSVLDSDGNPIYIRRFFSESKTDKFFEPSFKNFLLKNSRLTEFLYVKWHAREKRSAYHKKMMEKVEFGEGYQFFMIQPGHSLYQDKIFLDKALAQTTQYILGIKKLVEDENAKFMMVYVPMETQLKLEQYGEHSRMFTSSQWTDGMNQYLVNLSKRENIPYLDLLVHFEQNKSLGLYLSRDGHLTENGHFIAAQALSEFIEILNPSGLRMIPREK